MSVTLGVEQRSGEESAATVELAHLIQAMATGTESALAAFYDQTSHRIYGLVMRLLQDDALAEEVTLDIYLQVWREAARYRVERGSPWAWLVTLARSRAPRPTAHAHQRTPVCHPGRAGRGGYPAQ